MGRVRGVLAIAALMMAATGCPPAEGQRCNPLLFSDECSNGTQCRYPPACGVAYCCPPLEGTTAASHSNCQPCPSDGGTD